MLQIFYFSPKKKKKKVPRKSTVPLAVCVHISSFRINVNDGSDEIFTGPTSILNRPIALPNDSDD